jgi:hypothetical protein
MKLESIDTRKVMVVANSQCGSPGLKSVNYIDRNEARYIGRLMAARLQYPVEKKDIIRTLVGFRKLGNTVFDENSLIIMDKLLGDTKIMNKVKAIYANGIISNSIALTCYCNRFHLIPHLSSIVSSDPKTWNTTFDREFSELSPKDQIDWMYNHYDTIWFTFMPTGILEDGRLSIESIICSDDRMCNLTRSYDVLARVLEVYS